MRFLIKIPVYSKINYFMSGFRYDKRYDDSNIKDIVSRHSKSLIINGLRSYVFLKSYQLFLKSLLKHRKNGLMDETINYQGKIIKDYPEYQKESIKAKLGQKIDSLEKVVEDYTPIKTTLKNISGPMIYLGLGYLTKKIVKK